jgi:hypothetical protein
MLLNKFNLSIAKLASKEVSRFTLSGIHVTPKATVVTDGHSLMAVSTLETPAEGFPNRTDSGLTLQDTFKPFNLSAELALKAAADLPKRSNLPILQCAAIAVNGDPNKPKVLTTDLERHAEYPAMESANFPDWERVMPRTDAANFAISLDARKLKPILEQFIAFADTVSKDRAPVTFRFEDPTKAVRMDAKANEQTMTGLLMPMRAEETSETPHARMLKVDRLMKEYQAAGCARRMEIIDEVAELYPSPIVEPAEPIPTWSSVETSTAEQAAA